MLGNAACIVLHKVTREAKGEMSVFCAVATRVSSCFPFLSLFSFSLASLFGVGEPPGSNDKPSEF
jgi:hypothetical protein